MSEKIKQCWDGLRECKNTRLVLRLQAERDALMEACDSADNFLSWDKCDRKLDPGCVAYNAVKAKLRAALAKVRGEGRC